VPPDQWGSIERQLDDALMDAAVFVPMIYSKIVYWRAERLTNVYSTYFFGQYDVVNLGVSDGR
jgi:peptide/nickel transport system substrate-binding protein